MANVFELFQNVQAGFGRTERLTYPLENQSDYLGKITFGIIDDQHEDASTDLTDTPALMETLKESFKDMVGAEEGQGFIDYIFDPTGEQQIHRKIIQARISQVNLNLSGQFAAAKVMGATADALSAAHKKDFHDGPKGAGPVKPFNLSKNGGNRLTSKKIQLYLPRAISIADAATYDNNFQLGFIGATVESGLNTGGSVLSAVTSSVAQEVVGGINTILGNNNGMNKDLAALMAAKVAAFAPDMINGDGIQGAIKGATRTQLNPNTRALFKSVPIRNFAFTFSLIPTSRAEAQEVENIVKAFRQELYPTALQIAGIHVGYKFPNRFVIKVRYNNRDITGIKFLPVYLQSFQAVYNANSAGMHSDGKFSQVDISMAFTETRALTKIDITEGGY